MTDNARRWWHYTLGGTVFMILADGRIKRAVAHLEKGERSAVWFSCRPDWEPTATKGFIDARTGEYRHATIGEMLHAGGMLVRIEVPKDVARHTWADHRRIGNVDPRVLDRLEAVAREQGADPSEWRLSYHDVPIAKILSIEASEDGLTWTPVGEPASQGKALRLEAGFAERAAAAISSDAADALRERGVLSQGSER